MSANRRVALDEAIQRLYQVISFSEGGEPDWAGMRNVFAAGARITRITPEAVDALLELVGARREVVGYTSSYRDWLARVTPPDLA